MFDFQQKRKLRAITESKGIWVVLLFIGGFVLISAYDRYLIARDMADRRAAAEADVAALEVRRIELETDVQYLSNERGIEAEMRRQFDVAREGEQVVIIVEDEGESEAAIPVGTTTEPVSRPWYRFW